MSGSSASNNESGTISAATLKVFQRYASVNGPGVIAIDEDTMRSIGAKAGDIVEIQGKNKALAKIIRLHPSDTGRKIARIDEDSQKYAGVSAGNTVTIRRVSGLPHADKVVLGPLIPIPAVDESFFPDELDGYPLKNGSEIMVSYFGTRIPFKVVDIARRKPSSSSDNHPWAVVDRSTKFIIKAKWSESS